MGERATQPPPALPGDSGPSHALHAADSLKVTRFDEELSRPLLAELHGDLSLDAGAACRRPRPPSARRSCWWSTTATTFGTCSCASSASATSRCSRAARGLDALQKVREASPDVLLLDAMLPEVHGFDICRRIKGSRRYGHIPVVMVSAVYRGWRFAEDLRRSYGVDEFLEKPFRIGDVVAAVERAPRGREAHSQPPDEDADQPAGPAGDHLKAGIEAYSRGDVEGAIEHLKKGIGIDPLAFRLHYHLGLLYGKQDNVFEAIQALETAVDLQPRDFSTLKNLAVLYQRAGFRLKATEMWERALGSAPDDATRASIRESPGEPAVTCALRSRSYRPHQRGVAREAPTRGTR